MHGFREWWSRLRRRAWAPGESVRDVARLPEFRDDPLFAPLADMTEAEAEAALQAMERESESRLRVLGLRR